MSLNKYAAPLALEIAPSPRFALALACAHGGAAAVAMLLPLPYEWLWVVTVFILVHGAYAIWRHALLRSASSVVRVLWDTQDQWMLTRRDGVAFSAQLLPGSYLHPRLTVLNFKVARWRRASVVIVPSRVAVEGFRQLRVRLMLASSLPE